MSVTPWSGLELSGITIAQSPGAGPGHFLEARTFQLRVRLLSLFSQRLVIKEVSLVNPNVVWPQDVNGKWRLPGARQEEAHASEPGSDVAQSTTSAGITAGPPLRRDLQLRYQMSVPLPRNGNKIDSRDARHSFGKR